MKSRNISLFFLFLTWGHIFIDSKGEKERNTDGRETPIGYLPHTLLPGTEPTTQACALTGNQTCDILVYGTTLQPTEPPNLGTVFVFLSDLLHLI